MNRNDQKLTNIKIWPDFVKGEFCIRLKYSNKFWFFHFRSVLKLRLIILEQYILQRKHVSDRPSNRLLEGPRSTIQDFFRCSRILQIFLGWNFGSVTYLKHLEVWSFLIKNSNPPIRIRFIIDYLLFAYLFKYLYHKIKIHFHELRNRKRLVFTTPRCMSAKDNMWPMNRSTAFDQWSPRLLCHRPFLIFW